MPKFDRLRRPILSSLAGLSVAVLAFACSSGDEPTPTPGSGTPDPTGSATGTVSGPGTFIFEGVRVEPPFDVTSSGRSVAINGTTVMTLGGTIPDAPDLDAPIENAFGLADHAAAAYENAGGGAGALEAARDAIAEEPVLVTAIVDLEANELAITDTDGLQVFFRPEPVDGVVRARSEAELEADAAAQAAEWAAILAGDGLILVPTEGPTLTVAGLAAADLVAAIDEAMALPGAEREAALLELLTHEGVVADLLARYEPAAQTRRADAPSNLTAASAGIDGARATGGHEPIAFNASRGDTAATVAQAAAGISQTPGKPEAYVFATLYDADSNSFVRELTAEGYRVWRYDSENRAFGGSGFANFLATSGTGALYLATHGSPTGVSVESFSDAALAGRIHQQLTRTNAGDFTWWREGNGTWWLEISIQGLQQHWRSNNTIVHAAICNSNTLNSGFRAREYFAYQPTTSCAVAAPDTKLLWERMSGRQGNGAFRPASVAFAQGGFSGGFRHTDGSPDNDTVVSPGVKSFAGLELFVGEEGHVTIQFDAFLDATVPSKALSRVTGCIQPAADASYVFDRNQFALIVPVVATEVGEGGVTVIAAMTRSPGRIFLDGNQKPEGTSHVAENRDDYVGAVSCVAAGVVPSPTTGIEPPTATSTPSGTPDPTEPPPTETPVSVDAIAVGDEGALVPDGKIIAFFLNGVFYDASGLVTIGAHVPNCYYPHVHGGPITPVLPAGGATASEHLGECGFGPPNFYLINEP